MSKFSTGGGLDYPIAIQIFAFMPHARVRGAQQRIQFAIQGLNP
jgi:hypothetical protein